jgi:glyoxylate reductase
MPRSRRSSAPRRPRATRGTGLDAPRRTAGPDDTPHRDNPRIARCFITRALPFDALQRLPDAGHDLDVWHGPLPPTPQELKTHASQAEGLLSLLSDRIDADVIQAAPNLRVIANYAVGCDNIDLDAARARNVKVGVTPDVLTDATADLTWALILAAARRIQEAIDDVRAGAWHTWEPAGWLGLELSGATLGIIGRGRIGDAVARRAEGFGMNVRAVSSKSTPDDFTALLQSADVVSLHCPMTAKTRHLIDAAALAQMKPTAILVNTARGAIVDQRALAQALNAKALAGAALDVTDPEPLPPDDPLRQAPNLIVVPHIGSATHTTRERMAALAVDNLLAGLAGEPLPHPAPTTQTVRRQR